MEYILFTKEGKYLGLRGSEPLKEENLIVFEWYKEFEQITNPTLKNGKIVSGELSEEEKESQLLQLNLEYTEKISKLVSKFVEKNIIDGTPIPQEIIDERERLKLEYNNLKQLIK
jgi:F0F1-type ATP synthase gamma subunit